MTGDFFLTQWFFLAMRWLYENVVSNNIFLTILISTVVLRLLTLFSDVKQRKSSQKMAALQPQIAKLEERYKNNPEKMRLEQQKLMKESGVNMMGGCLPMIFTLVFLFCFIAAFRFWGYEQNVKMITQMSENIAVVMKAGGSYDQAALDAASTRLTKAAAAEAKKETSSDTTESDSADENGNITVTATTNDVTNADYISVFASLSDAERENIYEDKSMEISEAFKQSKFLWIKNIWQPDNGFSEVVTPANTFFGANYKSTTKLIYLEDHPEVKQEMIDLGIFYDKTPGYTNLSKEEKTKAKETAENVYTALMQPLENEYKGYNNGWFILPVLATLFQVLYMWYSQKKTANAQQAAGSTKFMLYVMPVMSFVFCLSYTSAFAIYWTLSSMIMLIVNIILTKVFDAKKDKKTA